MFASTFSFQNQGATYHSTEIIMFLVCTAINIAGFQFFNRVGSPTVGPNNQLLDPGLDLNMAEGMAEYVKDIVILTSASQVLAIFSNYCYCLLLIIPSVALFKLWTKVVAPWIFAPAPEEANSEADLKKQKKQERKLRRMR